MDYDRPSFLTRHKRTILGLLFGLAFSATVTYAVPPGSQYNPGDTLDPNCIPGSSNCSVDISGATLVWGGITGTLSNQTDLQDALDDKFDVPTGSTMEYIRGDGTIAAIPLNYVDNSYVGITSGDASDGTDGGGGYNIIVGDDAGSGSGTVNNSIFLGRYAGSGAANAIYSNFIGHNAGYAASDAYNANFIGRNAGNLASNAQFSVFVGQNAGQYATNAAASVFVGIDAGDGAANATNSIFIGKNTGQYVDSPGIVGTQNAANSIFIGTDAGYSTADTDLDNTAVFDDITTFANTSILMGHRASTGGFSNSIAIGAYATNTAANQLTIGSSNRKITSVRIGGNQGTASASNTILVGDSAGANASAADNSIFVGLNAGNGATSADASLFLGINAGNGATGARTSTFIGANAGQGASGVTYANFLGVNAGNAATNAYISTFIGYNAGNNAANSSQSIFIGQDAGQYNSNSSFGTPNAANSIFIGKGAGYSSADGTLNNTAAFNESTTFANTSILIGHRTSTGGFSNSIALGAYATNTATNQMMIGSTTRRIDDLVFNGGSGNTCSINAGTGITCSSDERLKTNIQDLDMYTLDKVLALRTVRYNWNSDPSGAPMIGFIAQNMEAQFPELVSRNIDGMLSVNYAQMTPILAEAIREINTKVVGIGNLTVENDWRSALLDWFGSTGNGIQRFFSREIHTDTLCVKKADGSEACFTGDQLQAAIGEGATVIETPEAPSEEGSEESSVPEGDTLEATTPPETLDEPAPVEPSPQPTPDPAPEAQDPAPIDESTPVSTDQ